MTKEQIQAIAKEDILPPYLRQQLSPYAVRLYEAVWFRGAGREITVQVLTNSDATKRSKMSIHKLRAAQDELAAAGLANIQQLNGCFRIELLPHPEPPTDDQLWERAMEIQPQPRYN